MNPRFTNMIEFSYIYYYIDKGCCTYLRKTIIKKRKEKRKVEQIAMNSPPILLTAFFAFYQNFPLVKKTANVLHIKCRQAGSFKETLIGKLYSKKSTIL